MTSRNRFNGKSKRMRWTEAKTMRSKSLHAVHFATDSASVVPAARSGVSRKSPMVTGAEQRVLTLVAQARTNKEIAVDLGISPATVKRHMEQILKKLGVRNRVEAAICGLMRNGCPHESSSDCFFSKIAGRR